MNIFIRDAIVHGRLFLACKQVRSTQSTGRGARAVQYPDFCPLRLLFTGQRALIILLQLHRTVSLLLLTTYYLPSRKWSPRKPKPPTWLPKWSQWVSAEQVAVSVAIGLTDSSRRTLRRECVASYVFLSFCRRLQIFASLQHAALWLR